MKYQSSVHRVDETNKIQNEQVQYLENTIKNLKLEMKERDGKHIFTQSF